MRAFIKNNDGKSSIEWLLVMLLLVLLAGGIFILAASSSDTYSKISSQSDADAEMRTALAYIGTKLKQNDKMNAVEVVQRTDMDFPAILIKENLLGTLYETWIYFDSGVLREVTIPENGKLDSSMSFEIASLEHFDVIKTDQGMIQVEVSVSGRPKRPFSYALKSSEEVEHAGD